MGGSQRRRSRTRFALSHSRWRTALGAARPPLALWAGAILLTAYAATLARSVTKWDSGEFLSAVYSLGVPHPPGTPLYVLIARVWSVIPLPLEFATQVNLFSAVCAAASVTLLGILFARWTGDRLGGLAATLCAGCTTSLWLSATETEVYAPALLFAILLLWVAAGDAPNHKRLMLLAYAAGLGWALHLTALLALPAAVALLMTRDRGLSTATRKNRYRTAAVLALAGVLGASAALYLLIRAQHDPPINQGNPVNLHALWDVLTRAQYAPPGLWPRRAPFWLQLGNWFEYADWQFALGLSPAPPAAWSRTVVTLFFAVLGVFGSLRHRAANRDSWRALLLAFLTGSLGAIAYLNLRAGPSYGGGVLGGGALHEPRERDYFFILSFVIWGAWAGYGAISAARSVAVRFARAFGARAILSTGVAVAALPLILNFGLVARERKLASELTRAQAMSLLVSLPERAVFLALGDNDTYPLWYLQTVEGKRRDVTVVTIPMLGARWYRQELHRRHDLFDTASIHRANGTSGWVAVVCREELARGRPVVLTPFALNRKLPTECAG